MTELADNFRFMNEDRKRRHAEMNVKNTAVLKESGIPFRVTNWGETFCIRIKGRKSVDFYPSTGRWREVGSEASGKTMKGGAKKFLRWYGWKTDS